MDTKSIEELELIKAQRLAKEKGIKKITASLTKRAQGELAKLGGMSHIQRFGDYTQADPFWIGQYLPLIEVETVKNPTLMGIEIERTSGAVVDNVDL